ncbi:Parvovirus coat protein VP1-like protein [Gracilibacillus salitolerans]|uniref:Parvovirus coat protein VP1-like protein n=1 Tax=Gracilibacillus salitolerans TaxID=2663022 RepID=UPI002D773C4D|nr:Parvovirus coat protein VP1-like protein [Gracilibacillus salitolerans]
MGSNQMPCLPGYRYCGPGCSGPGSPLNTLDVLCMKDDDCYRRHGSNKYCDELFMKRLQPYIHRRDKIGRDTSLMYRVISLKRGL